MHRRICIVLPNLAAGGVERVRLLLAEEFLKRGYRVSLVVWRAEGDLLAAVPPAVDLVDLGVRRLRQGVRPLLAYLRRTRPAAVLVAMWPLTGLATVAVKASGIDTRLVVSEHTTLSKAPAYRGAGRLIHRLFGARLYRSCDGVVAVSAGVRGDITELTGLSPDRVTVIHNPIRSVGSGAGQPNDATGDWWDQGGARLIAIGALKPQKDYPNLLRAFRLLLNSMPARLLILGEGGLRDELERMVRDLGLSDHIRMPGYISDPYSHLVHADLFVFSSAWEGLGNVIIEALACGTPGVSTDCPSGPAEILENGRFGRLVPVGDPVALALAMKEALAADHDREALRRRGAEFSVERAADQYLALLDPSGAREGPPLRDDREASTIGSRR